MGALDIVELPGHPGHYMRRVAVDAWIRAGRPRPRSTGRLYSEQKYLFDGWRAGKPGFYPADNPDATWMQLSHVRFVAIDIWDNYSYWRPKMLAAGWLPLSHEPWHFYLPNPQQYALVTSIPASATDGSTAFPTPTVAPLEDDMALPIRRASNGQCFTMAPGFVTYETNPATAVVTRNVLTASDKWHELDETGFWGLCNSLQIPRAAINVITASGAKTRTWSKDNDGVERAEAVLAKLETVLAQLAAVVPPKA